MTIHFYHDGNSLGEVTTETAGSALEAEIFAATARSLPFQTAADAATDFGWDVLTFNDDDANLTVTSYALITA